MRHRSSLTSALLPHQAYSAWAGDLEFSVASGSTLDIPLVHGDVAGSVSWSVVSLPERGILSTIDGIPLAVGDAIPEAVVRLVVAPVG